MPTDRRTAGHAGEFGPDSYRSWRATSLGTITEHIERRLILRLVGPLQGRSALDVGCGDGNLTLALRQGGASAVVGCDADPRMIASAAGTARHERAISYAVGRAEYLPFRDGSFDLVTAIAVLAFVPDARAAVREMARVLRPGGRLVIGDLGKWSSWAFTRRIRGWVGSQAWRAARFRSANELRALVQAAKLRVEQVSGAVYYPRSGLIARLMAPADPFLSDRTTLGGAFLAVQASKI